MKKSDIVISVDNLQKSYGKTEVLKAVTFTVRRGTMLAILGPNGAGKTTTVRILSTLLSYDGGDVTVNGHNVSDDADGVRKSIGLTGQSAAVDELLTGRENLVMMGRLYRLTPASAKTRADELLKEFDLVDAANRPAKTYSGGMRRRLDLAVSLIATPPIIFLDEPTTGLDPRSRQAMWDIIRNLLDNGTTVLLTTQYLEEADQLADNVIVIDDGRVIAEGTPKALKSRVGKDRLEITFAKKAELTAAKKAIGKDVVDANDETLELSVVIQDTHTDIQQILNLLSDKSIAIETMSIHKPTLDDVFLSLTGKNHSPEKGDES